MTGLHEQQHHLGEHLADVVLEPLAPEAVDGVMVGPFHAREPHEVDVLLEGSFDPPRGVDVVQVGVYKHLQQHAWAVSYTHLTLPTSDLV